MKIRNIDVNVIGDEMSSEEIEQYIEYIEREHNRSLQKLEITVDGEFVDLHFFFKQVRFERIRRITGYLVGTMDKWNDSKTAEEADRVKHGLDEPEKI